MAFALWVPLVLDIYPAPWQREAEIKAMALEALASQKSLADMGVDTTDIVHAQTEEEWTQGLTESYWTMWTETWLFFSLELLPLGLPG